MGSSLAVVWAFTRLGAPLSGSSCPHRLLDAHWCLKVRLALLCTVAGSSDAERRQFSLAAALFGWPPAPGHAAPNEAVPDAWVLLFREHHAATDPAVLSGIFTACPAGRDCALQWAPKVTLTLDTTAQDQPHSAWVQRTSVLQCILSARARPAASDGPMQAAGVCLRVTVDESAHSAAACSALSTLLCEDSSPVTELYVRHVSDPELDHDPSASLPNPLFPTSTVYPCLTSLTLEACPYAAPAPESVPSLRQVTLTCGDREYYWHDQPFSQIVHSTHSHPSSHT